MDLLREQREPRSSELSCSFAVACGHASMSRSIASLRVVDAPLVRLVRSWEQLAAVRSSLSARLASRCLGSAQIVDAFAGGITTRGWVAEAVASASRAKEETTATIDASALCARRSSVESEAEGGGGSE